MHLWMDADHRLINIFPSDRKHSSRNCIKFADVKYLVLIVDSRGEKKVLKLHDTESRNSMRNGHIVVQFREITLYWKVILDSNELK